MQYSGKLSVKNKSILTSLRRKPQTEKSVNIKINIVGQVALLLPTEAQASAKYTVNRRSFSELLRFFLLRHRRFTVSVYACKRRLLVSVTFSTVFLLYFILVILFPFTTYADFAMSISRPSFSGESV